MQKAMRNVLWTGSINDLGGGGVAFELNIFCNKIKVGGLGLNNLKVFLSIILEIYNSSGQN